MLHNHFSGPILLFEVLSTTDTFWILQDDIVRWDSHAQNGFP